MPKYVQATMFRVKPDQMDPAREEIGRWIAGYEGIGATVTYYTEIGGTPGVALASVEFPDGETWLKSIEDPRLLEARQRMTESSWPIEIVGSSAWQEVPRG